MASADFDLANSTLALQLPLIPAQAGIQVLSNTYPYR
jgi:hypothetical protein